MRELRVLLEAVADPDDAAALLDELPEDQVASAYMSGPGARTLLRNPSISALDTDF